MIWVCPALVGVMADELSMVKIVDRSDVSAGIPVSRKRGAAARHQHVGAGFPSGLQGNELDEHCIGQVYTDSRRQKGWGCPDSVTESDISALTMQSRS